MEWLDSGEHPAGVPNFIITLLTEREALKPRRGGCGGVYAPLFKSALEEVGAQGGCRHEVGVADGKGSGLGGPGKVQQGGYSMMRRPCSAAVDTVATLRGGTMMVCRECFGMGRNLLLT